MNEVMCLAEDKRLSIFYQDLSLDIDSTIKHSEKLIKDGLHGTVLFGSTGCAQLISSKEKKLIVCFGSLYNVGNILNKN